MKSISKYIGPTQATPYATSRLSPIISLQDSLSQLDSTNQQIVTITSTKLKLIQDQIDYLQQQAIQIIESANQNMLLHNIPCGVTKRPGNTYFLYEKKDSNQFFSILSPEEWGNMIPGKFVSAYRLEHDMTWTLDY
jgi:hypothetical protein